MDDNWKERLKKAKEETPEGSGKHAWFKFQDDKFDCCAWCGVIRRSDDKNKPCPGKVKVSLRGNKNE